jgi:uroporphyrinogen-III synthase
MSMLDTSLPLFLLARSKPPGPELRAALDGARWRWRHVPLVETRPAPLTAALQFALEQAKSADWRVFVSPAAVHAAAVHVPEFRMWPGQQAAVGAQTAALLGQALAPCEGEGAAALLAQLPSDLSGKTVAIFAARDGLGLLHNTCAARGARMIAVPAYQRVTPKPTPATRAACVAAHRAYVGSVAFLDALMVARGHVPLMIFAPSARVCAHARHYRCAVVDCGASNDQALIAQLVPGVAAG